MKAEAELKRIVSVKIKKLYKPFWVHLGKYFGYIKKENFPCSPTAWSILLGMNMERVCPPGHYEPFHLFLPIPHEICSLIKLSHIRVNSTF